MSLKGSALGLITFFATLGWIHLLDVLTGDPTPVASALLGAMTVAVLTSALREWAIRIERGVERD